MLPWRACAGVTRNRPQTAPDPVATRPRRRGARTKLAPLLAVEGIDVADINAPQQALDRAVERQNMAGGRLIQVETSSDTPPRSPTLCLPRTSSKLVRAGRGDESPVAAPRHLALSSVLPPFSGFFHPSPMPFGGASEVRVPSKR